MRILGIDPGIGRTGWGIIESNAGKFSPVNYGCLETKAGVEEQKRLIQLYEGLGNIITENKPEIVAVEDLFFNTNAKTALRVGQARGVTLLACAQKNLPTYTFTPLQVKMSITGYGRADKNQIALMVKSLLNLKTVPKPDDVTDALAASLTCAFHHKTTNNIFLKRE